MSCMRCGAPAELGKGGLCDGCWDDSTQEAIIRERNINKRRQEWEKRKAAIANGE